MGGLEGHRSSPIVPFQNRPENTMTAFNAVRFKIKPGREQEFLDAHRKIHAEWPGLRHVNMIKTGERSYCIIAEWSDMESMASARPNMIKTLDSFRDTLEDLGGGLGVTDPVSGPVVLALK
jgi:quinol monooxygenase YgiN